MISPEKKAVFKAFFYPRSVAIVGVSDTERSWGRRQMDSLLKFGYGGKLYPVNPRGGEFFGLKSYPSVSDIPDDIDLAIIAIPARGVPAVVEECLGKGIKAVEVLSAGFNEVGEEGRKLEAELVSLARRGISIVGPNCFGVHCSESGITTIPGANVFTREKGTVGLVSQSGQWTDMIPLQAKGLGIRFGKVVSYGNACDLNEADFLEYLGEDPETGIIVAYIEGARDGRRLLEVVRRTTKTKPVIIWKAGLTPLGRRAASSHTASLGGELAVWEAFIRQSGAITANSIEEINDTTLALIHLPRDCGRRVAIVSGGGGATVVGSDACERWGLSLPLLSPVTQEKLHAILPEAGASVKNPVDMASPMPPARDVISVLEILAKSGEIDVIIMRRIFLTQRGNALAHGWLPPQEDNPEPLKLPIVVKEQFGLPIIMVLIEETTELDKMEFERDRRQWRDYYIAHGIPVYPTLDRAIRALGHFIRYQQQGG